MHTWLPRRALGGPGSILADDVGGASGGRLLRRSRFKVVVDACLGTSFPDRMLILTRWSPSWWRPSFSCDSRNYKRMLGVLQPWSTWGLMCLGSGLARWASRRRCSTAVTHARRSRWSSFCRARSAPATARPASPRCAGSSRAAGSGPAFARYPGLLGLPPSACSCRKCSSCAPVSWPAAPGSPGRSWSCWSPSFVAMLGHLNRILMACLRATSSRRRPTRASAAASAQILATLLVIGVALRSLLRLLAQASGIVAP